MCVFRISVTGTGKTMKASYERTQATIYTQPYDEGRRNYIERYQSGQQGLLNADCFVCSRLCVDVGATWVVFDSISPKRNE